MKPEANMKPGTRSEFEPHLVKHDSSIKCTQDSQLRKNRQQTQLEKVSQVSQETEFIT